MKYIKILLILACLISVYSCESKSNGLFKKENTNLIEQYIDSDSLNHTSYLMMSVNECVRNDHSLSGFVIGPMYANMWPSFKEDKCQMIYSHNGANVYLYTHLSEILELPIEKQAVRYCSKDSILFLDGYSKEPIINYFKRAWVISFSDNKVLYKTNVDQLFLPDISITGPITGTGF